MTMNNRMKAMDSDLANPTRMTHRHQQIHHHRLRMVLAMEMASYPEQSYQGSESSKDGNNRLANPKCCAGRCANGLSSESHRI